MTEERRPPVNFGDLRRVKPIARRFGYDRGTPVDRHYIEAFLAGHASLVRGRVLEVGDDTYTRRFGGARVTTSDVLHVLTGQPGATVIADLTNSPHLPSDAFHCVIVTQTLQLIYDVQAAVKTLHRILKPGGVILATMPGISQVDDPTWASSWHWSFTTVSARRLFGDAFGDDNVEVEAHGNVLTAVAFLHGLATEDLEPHELARHDPAYPFLITVKAVKHPATRDGR